jgi:hypothetical protein
VTYKFLPSGAKAAVMGALCAGKERRGGVDFELQLPSLKVLFGVTTNWSPVLRRASLIALPSQAVKQVG